jgi:elongation factor 1-gamma
MYAMVGQIFGWSPLDRVQYATMENGLLRVMAVLHEHLQGRKYFVGEEISIADLGIAVMLSLLFKLVLDEEMRQRYSNVTEWYKRISSLPAFETVLGKTWLCEKKY